MSELELAQEYNKGYQAGISAHYDADLEIPLRDQFAMAALTGLITTPPLHNGASAILDEKILAKQSYIMADAMLEARKK